MGLATGITMRFFENAVPLNAGLVYFYEAGTATLKTIYTDSTYGTAAANPATTNANGEVTVWGTGLYKVVAKNAAGGTVDSEDNVNLGGTGSGQGTATPFDFSGVGDDSNDDSTPIQDMFDDCATTGNKAVFPAGYTWKTTVGVTADGSFDIQMDSPIKFYGAANSNLTALKVGSATVQNDDGHFDLWVIRDGHGDFTGADHTGIEICNINGSRFRIRPMFGGFTNGLLLHADATTVTPLGYLAWNRFDLGFFQSSKYSVRFKYTTGAGTPFINENTFYGGGFQTRNTAVAASTEVYGFYSDVAAGSFNTNRFYDQDFELNHTEGAVVFTGVAFDFARAIEFQSYGTRLESCDIGVRLAGSCSNCIFRFITTTETVVTLFADTSIYQNNRIIRESDPHQVVPQVAWDSGPLSHIATDYDGSKICIPGFSGITPASESAPTKALPTNFTIKPPYIKTTGSSAGIGFLVDVSRTTKFAVYKEFEPGFPGRFALQPQDVYGAPLMGAAYGDTIRASIPISTVWTDNTGLTFPIWSQAADYDDRDDYIGYSVLPVSIIDSDVKSVYVYLGNGTANMKLKRVMVASLDGTAIHVTSGCKGWGDRQRVSQVEPTIGWYSAGEIIEHDDTTVDTPIAWRPDIDGYMCADAWGAGAVAVDAVVHKAGEVYICIVAGTSTGGPTGTSGEITDNDVKWRHVAALVTGFTAINSTSNITNLTDNSGGTANDTVEAIPAVNGSGATTAQETAIANNFADLAAKVQKLIDNAKGS